MGAGGLSATILIVACMAAAGVMYVGTHSSSNIMFHITKEYALASVAETSWKYNCQSNTDVHHIIASECHIHDSVRSRYHIPYALRMWSQESTLCGAGGCSAFTFALGGIAVGGLVTLLGVIYFISIADGVRKSSVIGMHNPNAQYAQAMYAPPAIAYPVAQPPPRQPINLAQFPQVASSAYDAESAYYPPSAPSAHLYEVPLLPPRVQPKNVWSQQPPNSLLNAWE